MKFVIDQSIFETFRGLNIGVVVAREVNNLGRVEEIEQLTREVEQTLRVNMSSSTVSEHPKIQVWREADRTKLTEDMRNCILVIEGLPPVTKDEVRQSTLELVKLIEKYCGGTISHTLLDVNDPEFQL